MHNFAHKFSKKFAGCIPRTPIAGGSDPFDRAIEDPQLRGHKSCLVLHFLIQSYAPELIRSTSVTVHQDVDEQANYLYVLIRRNTVDGSLPPHEETEAHMEEKSV